MEKYPSNFVIPSVFEVTDKGARSYDIYSKLLEQRIIFLNGEVREENCNLIVASLLYLDSISSDDIYLYINSPGGSCIDGLQVIDTMRLIKSDVATVVTGMAASMGFAILTSGTKGKRFALPHAQIMAHRVSSGTRGNIQDMEISFKHSKHIDTILAQLIADNIGMDKASYLRKVQRDLWLTADEAIKFGAADSILVKGGK